MSMEKGNLSINSENIFPIIKKWLYSDHDIFYRELISNGCDAITKLKKLAMIGEFDEKDGEEYHIDVEVSSEDKTIVIRDNGIGMTADEVKEYINQIAFSGAADFLEKYKDKANDDQIIGHFGLGFYSSFMVAHKVTISTLSYKPDAKPVFWSSEEGMEFEMDEGDRTERGTEITLYLNEDSYEFANEYRAKEVLEKYCSFMPVPIYFRNADKPEEEEKKGDEASGKTDDKVIDAEIGEDGKAKEAEKKPEKKSLNETAPLWTKHPNDCTDDEYKEFYRKVFHDYREPLFWIHLNMDYPFNLKGILYFPKINIEYESIEGVIKLYSNQVFIADNIKEVIPEFLMLLKGVIDCPDLPLNVSRSALQNDGFVKKISDYITKKVADKLSGMFKTDRENYEKYWDDISPFIKYGFLKDEKFKEKIADYIIYKDLDGKYITLTEYLDAAKKDTLKENEAKEGEQTDTAEGKEVEKTDDSADKAEDDQGRDDSSEAAEDDDFYDGDDKDKKEDKRDKVYYVTDEKQQSQYINIFRAEGLNAVLLTHNIDQPFIQQLEAGNDKIRFLRIDSDVTAGIKEEVSGNELKDLEKEQKTLEKLFRKVLNKEKLEVKVEKLKDEKISAMVTLSEESRRMSDMMKMYSMPGMGGDDLFGGRETLILNANNSLVQYIAEHKKGKKVELLSAQLYDLAMLSHKPLAPEAMTGFIERSNEILEMISKEK
ncbi:MAG: molecular chaperone HtpG [Lachnospiraceae bacterium]|nr:molecular chaperone HtpG [Lachnospiraceae bacterium]